MEPRTYYSASEVRRLLGPAPLIDFRQSAPSPGSEQGTGNGCDGAGKQCLNPQCPWWSGSTLAAHRETQLRKPS